MLSSLVLAAGFAAGALAADDMGPAAFLWPPDRVWSASMDNTAPCGSSASVINRTDFPLTGGFLSLVGQEESYYVQLSISYQENPTTNSDFDVIVSSSQIKDLLEGHTCVDVPDAASTVTVGTNATFQAKYESAWDSSVNETYYACADVTYIEAADFTNSYWCFNVTEESDDDDTTATTTSSSSSTTSTGTSSKTSEAASSSSSSSSSSSGGISKGAIAGAVVGSVVGAAILGVVAFYMYRLGARHQQQTLMRQHMNEMTLTDMDKKAGGSGNV